MLRIDPPAGHYPQIERPEEVPEAIDRFARGGVVMKVWHFSETAYHPAWSQLGVYRVVIPSRLYDPKIGADLYHRNLDESRDGRNIDPRTMTVEDAIDAGLVFAGTPDDVFAQLHAFHAHVGGFGHLLMMGQGALLDHNETVANLTLFSKEVLPRVENLSVM